MPPAEPAYGVQFFARLFDLTQRRVQQLAKEGVMVKAERGKYLLLQSVTGYVQYLRKQADGTGPAGDFRTQRIAREKVATERAEFDLAVARGEYVPIDDVAQVFQEASVMLASQLDGIAGRIAGGDAVLRERLKVELRRVRDNYANQLEAFADSSEGREPDPAAAQPRAVGVGGSKKGAAKGKR